MSNTKGNQYPTWGIDINGQIFAVDSNNQTHSKSNESFSFFDIGIAEDGTVWALSSQPDPDGGGSRIYWSNGDGTWNEINTPDPGGVDISGGPGSSCIYISGDSVLRQLQTDGTATIIYNTHPIYDADYGGGKVWAMLSDKPGEPISLHYADMGASLSFKEFGSGNQDFPYSLSVSYTGDCFAVVNFSPVYYSHDGSSTGSAGAGLEGKALMITFKNWNYVLATMADTNGNEVWVWKDEAGGTYVNAGFSAIKVLASYYTAA